jgi:hypothetical protein
MKTSKDSEVYLRQLRKAGYEIRFSRGSEHWQIRWEGRLVTVHSGTPGGGRGLANLKARIRRFERERQLCPR